MGIQLPGRRPSKYRAVRTTADGLSFASKKEATRYCQLKLLQTACTISNLRMQVPYKLIVNGVLVCRYISDFEYVEKGISVVEDAKGYRTREYRLKKKLMLALFGITIREV